MKDKLSFSRIFAYLAGLLLLAFGVAASVASDLGATPGATIPYMLNVTVNIEFGTATFLWLSFLVVVQIIIQHKEFTPWILLQLLASFIFGYFNTFAVWIFSIFYTPEGIIGRLILLAAGVILSGVGVWLYSNADIVNMPSEGIGLALSKITGKPFHILKIIFDVVCVAAACVLCLIFTHSIGSFGVGTIINAVMLGTIVGICERFWGSSLNALFIKDKTRLIK